MQNLHQTLTQRIPNVLVTNTLIIINITVFFAMVLNGAGLWQSVKGVQLAWGANFGPATQDGEWWRLGSAMFLHFSLIHLGFNMWSLRDAGQLVERMYGHARFACIYLVSGLFGNLTSLVMHGNTAVSGGASSAIFGIYGALLVYLWAERKFVSLREFRWLFWGAIGFALITIVYGFIMPGIDNAAHIGGFIGGLLFSLVAIPSASGKKLPSKTNWLATGGLIIFTALLISSIPPPKYKWRDELALRAQIDEFMQQDQAINRSWLALIQASKQENVSFAELANQVDKNIATPYEESFEKLSQLQKNPALPSAEKLAQLLQYTQQRKVESELLAEKLKKQGASKAP